MGDGRSNTPYLGSNETDHDNNKKQMASTQQLLMMTASSINHDADSQKQTQRSHNDEFQSRTAQNQRRQTSLPNHNAVEQVDSNPNGSSHTMSMFPESAHGAAYRQAQTKSTNDFKRKLGHLKEALSSIKTNLSAFKQSAST